MKWLVSGCNFISFVPQLIKIQLMKLLLLILDFFFLSGGVNM